MIEHKKRVIFYPMQLRDFVRDHGAELPIGIPVAYDTIKPERYCIVRPNRFRFYHELCGANGLPLNFFISMRHIFTGASPVFYASARAELMRMGEHPMFTLVDNWDPLQRFGLRRTVRSCRCRCTSEPLLEWPSLFGKSYPFIAFIHVGTPSASS